ncbi:GNAT family N-acetyltransferase [Paenibacillus tepidiphilus]|uniref:GNAT family N-acetyltransferase n=1 Tax=Paenibacillus tepidiphilus TaxID=2608683 RepID=UPI00123B9CA7|nr:GNAT family N-acetyltransferase [Paenibacillus tepidiphilus]
MGVTNIETDRLLIIPITYSMANSILHSDYKAFDNMGVHLSGKWPKQDTLDILHFIKDTLSKDDEVDGFGVWMIVKKEDMTAIGDAGFKGGPDENGAIEIGFGLVEEEQRKGYGYEAASSLLEWGSQIAGVKVIKADCLIDNAGSIHLLKKCGMRETGRDLELIYWEKNVSLH